MCPLADMRRGLLCLVLQLRVKVPRVSRDSHYYRHSMKRRRGMIIETTPPAEVGTGTCLNKYFGLVVDISSSTFTFWIILTSILTIPRSPSLPRDRVTACPGVLSHPLNPLQDRESHSSLRCLENFFPQ